MVFYFRCTNVATFNQLSDPGATKGLCVHLNAPSAYHLNSALLFKSHSYTIGWTPRRCDLITLRSGRLMSPGSMPLLLWTDDTLCVGPCYLLCVARQRIIWWGAGIYKWRRRLLDHSDGMEKKGNAKADKWREPQSGFLVIAVVVVSLVSLLALSAVRVRFIEIRLYGGMAHSKKKTKLKNMTNVYFAVQAVSDNLHNTKSHATILIII